jgi:acetyl esterase
MRMNFTLTDSLWPWAVDSAGGNLAAVLALMARDGELPAVCFQALLYPVTDLTCSQPSYARVINGLPLTASTMHYFIQHYTPHAADRSKWKASPLLTPSFSGCRTCFGVHRSA